MTRDYSKGNVYIYIYIIEPILDHEEHEVKIGSTTKKYLSQRMTAHRYSYDDWKKKDKKKVIAFDYFINMELIIAKYIY